MLSLVSFDFSFSVGAACLKKFSSSAFKSGFGSGFGTSAGFSCGAEKKLEKISSFVVVLASDFPVSRPSRSAEPLELLLVSVWLLVGVLRPNFGLTDDFGLGKLGMTSDF